MNQPAHIRRLDQRGRTRFECDPDGDSLAAAARRLTVAGLRAFPLVHERPLAADYLGDSAFSLAQIEAMPWELATGTAISLGSDLIALDVPLPSGGSPDPLAWMEARFGPLPPTAAQCTVSRGLQLLFRLPPMDGSRVPIPRLLCEPSGSTIDVVHRKFGFIVIGDAAGLASSASDIAVLPQRWLEPLTTAPGPGADAILRTGFQLSGAAERVVAELALLDEHKLVRGRRIVAYTRFRALCGSAKAAASVLTELRREGLAARCHEGCCVIALFGDLADAIRTRRTELAYAHAIAGQRFFVGGGSQGPVRIHACGVMREAV